LLYILSYFKKYKSLGPNWWTIGLFLVFYEMVEEDLVRVIDEVNNFGKMPSIFNTTFTTLILKKISLLL
jgi:hypothetical protein